MTESQFIEQNESQWRELESLLEKPNKDADKLHSLFVKVSSDLSYARTFYPNRSVRLYLNNLTQKVLDSMRTNEDKVGLKKITHFYSHILPTEIYRSRKAFLISFLVFALAMSIGVLSSIYNPDFPTVILGERYIEMTDKFIEEGDPMAVYKDEKKAEMFFRITTNNMRVSFLSYVLGLIGSVGTIFVLLSNGIMVGAFQFYFYSKGLFLTSFLTIWIHGTIEISSIIIAGAAGIILGNGILFPKTHERFTALQVSAVRSLRIIVAIIPLIIIAGFLESYITRLTELPNFVKAGIIIVSLLFILTTFVFYPWYYKKSGKYDEGQFNIEPQHHDILNLDKHNFRKIPDIISNGFYHFRTLLARNLYQILLPTFLALTLFLWVYMNTNFNNENTQYNISLFKFDSGGLLMIGFTFLLLSIIIVKTKLILDFKSNTPIRTLQFIKENVLMISIASAFLYLPYALIPAPYSFLAYLIIPPHFSIYLLENTRDSQLENESIFNVYKKAIKNWPNYVPLYLCAMVFYVIGYLLINSQVTQFVIEFIQWHEIFNLYSVERIFVYHLFTWINFFFAFIIFYYLVAGQIYSLDCKRNATDLNRALKTFGKKSKVFETI